MSQSKNNQQMMHIPAAFKDAVSASQGDALALARIGQNPAGALSQLALSGDLGIAISKRARAFEGILEAMDSKGLSIPNIIIRVRDFLTPEQVIELLVERVGLPSVAWHTLPRSEVVYALLKSISTVSGGKDILPSIAGTILLDMALILKERDDYDKILAVYVEVGEVDNLQIGHLIMLALYYSSARSGVYEIEDSEIEDLGLGDPDKVRATLRRLIRTPGVISAFNMTKMTVALARAESLKRENEINNDTAVEEAAGAVEGMFN